MNLSILATKVAQAYAHTGVPIVALAYQIGGDHAPSILSILGRRGGASRKRTRRRQQHKPVTPTPAQAREMDHLAFLRRDDLLDYLDQFIDD